MTDLSPDADAGARRPERPYQSLYRRYRPQRFAEVRGQDHVSRALRNAVRDERISHAYLFSGPRGTGKTSTARILAKALNCTAQEGGEPCGTCASCLSIVAGTSFDVHELDAASNNGVDAMRDLVGRAALATPGRWKVYIVDEVHMLSTAASNALLKTLEEPPEHVVFVLATTDPQKVLPTIRSRTQHFEFHLLGDDVLGALLEDVVAAEGLDLPDGGIGVALRRGRGSARDALSMLDQVSASGSAEDDSGNLGGVVTGIARRDTAAAIAALDDALRRGRDPQQVAVELVERLRSGFLALVAPGADGAVAGGTTALEEARVLGTARCVRAMELLGVAIVAMRDAPEPRITLEVALVRCAHPDADETVESLLDRLEHVERRLDHLERGGTAASGPPGPPDRHERSSSQAPPRMPPAAATVGPGAATVEAAPTTATAGRPVLGAYRRRADPSPPEQRQAERQPATGAVPAGAAPAGAVPAVPRPGSVPDRDELVSAWGDRLLVGLRPKVRAYYQAGHFVGSEGADAIFALPNAVHVNQAEPLRGEVADALAAHFGRPIGLRLVVDGSWQPGDGPAPGPGATGGTVGPAPAAPTDAGPVASAHATAEAEDEDVEELLAGGTDGLASDTGASGLAWQEDRLLQAFPGAEEV